jgi:hypothetical protein
MKKNAHRVHPQTFRPAEFQINALGSKVSACHIPVHLSQTPERNLNRPETAVWRTNRSPAFRPSRLR